MKKEKVLAGRVEQFLIQESESRCLPTAFKKKQWVARKKNKKKKKKHLSVFAFSETTSISVTQSAGAVEYTDCFSAAG